MSKIATQYDVKGDDAVLRKDISVIKQAINDMTGLTATQTFKDGSNVTKTMTIKNGRIISIA